MGFVCAYVPLCSLGFVLCTLHRAGEIPTGCKPDLYTLIGLHSGVSDPARTRASWEFHPMFTPALVRLFTPFFFLAFVLVSSTHRVCALHSGNLRKFYRLEN